MANGSNACECWATGLTVDFVRPRISSDGKYLFFLSDRDYNLTFSDFEFNYIYDNATRILRRGPRSRRRAAVSAEERRGRGGDDEEDDDGGRREEEGEG